jgi:hypothetical protein
MSQMLWEILVPAATPCGATIEVAHHRTWDAFVQERAGGMTLHKPTRGTWVDSGRVITEPMIPVRILCDAATIEEIVEFTIDHYCQEAVLAYRISECIIMRRRESETAPDGAAAVEPGRGLLQDIGP